MKILLILLFSFSTGLASTPDYLHVRNVQEKRGDMGSVGDTLTIMNPDGDPTSFTIWTITDVASDGGLTVWQECVNKTGILSAKSVSMKWMQWSKIVTW